MRKLALIFLLTCSMAWAGLPVAVPLSEAVNTLGAVQYNCQAGGFCYVRLAWLDATGAAIMTCVRLPNQPISNTHGWASAGTYAPPFVDFNFTAAETSYCQTDTTEPPPMAWKTVPAVPVKIWHPQILIGGAWLQIGYTFGGMACEGMTAMVIGKETYQYTTGPWGSPRGLAKCEWVPK